MMRHQLSLFLLAGLFLLSCAQTTPSKAQAREPEGVNTIRRYTYTDSAGGRLILFNSPSRGGGYKSTDGIRHPYVVFYTQVTNQTAHPIEIRLEAPADSFEFPQASGIYMHLLLPSDTMRADGANAMDYGLPVKHLLDSPSRQSPSLQRTIAPNDSTAVYVVLTSRTGVGGVMRTGLRMEDGDLVYKIAAYQSIAGNPILGEKDLKLGSISLEPGVWRKD